MSDVRATELPSAGEVPPRPDLPAAHGAPGDPAQSRTRDREDEMDRGEQQAHTAIQPFEPIVTDDAVEQDAEPVPPQVAQEASHDEPDPEPKRRWRRKRKQSQPEPVPEVPLEQGRAESVPGPRGMFEAEATDDAPGPEHAPPPPAGIDVPAVMTRPDAAPITPFERESVPAPQIEPEPQEQRGPVIVPTPGRYRLPDDFAFGPGAKPHKAKRGT